MNEEQRKEQENIRRVGINLGVLLDIGLFPGQHAMGIAECQGLVKSIVASATEKLRSLTPPAPEPPRTAAGAPTLAPPPAA